MTKIYRKLLPLVTFTDIADCVPLATLLIESGTPQIEIAFRSPLAAEAIATVSKIPGIQVGAGTVLSNHQAEEAIAAGASFLVSPGFSDEVAKTAIKYKIDYFPGVVTPTEITHAIEYGFNVQKFFPAESYGGINTLNSLHAPFKGIKFIPTGGINLNNYKNYLSLSFVEAVGGSFITPEEYIKAKNWEALKAYIESI